MPGADAFALEDVLWRIGLALDRARVRQGLSVQALVRRAGTSHVTFARLVRPRPFDSVTLRTVCRLADALGMRVNVTLTERP